MKKLLFVCISFLMVNCSHLIDEPKNLIPKDQMSEIIAEFAMNDQLRIIDPEANLENATRYTLNKYHVKGNQFTESYKFYIATGKLEKILDNAQKIILEKHPEAKSYIDQKIKENPNVPAFAR
ncbi:DUF4296 domain-containing protein [Chryseobacterium koreense]|uniref:DUF4296 domain-containing protein n=1 Tax=Chryseobacterium koreense CCUG 49689 TaxID=1304281 RepID=A0A0J7J2U9_9FLAO|nr:DUF4296 domain-containing protein [Chryseobacterium koreense]KMQ72384.1 hypothetical protein ACM44_02455 [Chryseobacterium koreense CCUG 49689]MBB5333983.1 hypothetical protein [Chryseobacterium koreense]